MARAKKINRESSFVTLRTKPVSKGRQSYYLDIYKDGQRKDGQKLLTSIYKMSSKDLIYSMVTIINKIILYF